MYQLLQHLELMFESVSNLLLMTSSLLIDLMRRQEELRRLEELRNQELVRRKQIEMRCVSTDEHMSNRAASSS